MASTDTNTWREFHPFPLTDAQRELLDHYRVCRAIHPIKQNAEVIE